MKHLKTLSLVALAVAAMTAIGGASSAAATEFHSTGGTALNGMNQNPYSISIEGSSIICNTAELTGTAPASGTSITQTYHFAYSHCEAFGLPATVSTNSCRYEFNANTNTINLQSCTTPISMGSTARRTPIWALQEAIVRH
jgi:hypothetical protein